MTKHHERTVCFCAQCKAPTSHDEKKLLPNEEIVLECQSCGTLKVDYHDI